MDGSHPFDLKLHDEVGKDVSVRLPSTNTNLLPGGKWVWSDADRKKWGLVTDEYQKFYEHWRRHDPAKFPTTFPYKLSLGVNKGDKSLLPDIIVNEIVVTEPYNKAFYRLLRLRNNDIGAAKGAVLTGQPGIGAFPRPDPHPVWQLTYAFVLQESHLPDVHARAANLSSSGCTSV